MVSTVNFSELSLIYSNDWRHGMEHFWEREGLHLHYLRWIAVCRKAEYKTRILRFQPRPMLLSWHSSLAELEVSYSQLGIYYFSNAGAKKPAKRIRSVSANL